jgi:TonB family protein
MKILSLLIISCLLTFQGAEWPSKRFIKKHKYQEVQGEPTLAIQIQGDCSQIEKYPMYPSGLNGVYGHIRKNTIYPREAIDQSITGRVILSFVIGYDGYVQDINIIQSVHPLLDNEAIRVVKCMDRWISGVCNGQFVKVQYNLPFKFSIK